MVSAASIAVASGMAAGLAPGSPASAASSKSPITIVMISSLTGPGGSEFATGPAGFNARIAAQNAAGGVAGHKIIGRVIDDQTSPSNVVTAVQSAISQGAFGIVSVSPLFFAADKYPQQAGMPVTGGFFDGPEWGEQPFTNMFASDAGSENVKYPVNTGIGTFMKAHGGKVICSYGYGISPSSTRSAVGTVQSFQHAGGMQGVLNTSIPFGSVDMTNEALVAKQKGCDSYWAGLDDNSNVALATSLKQAGAKTKVVVFPTGYEPSIIGGPAWGSVQGAYFLTGFRPFQLPNAGTRAMQAALIKYAHFKPNQFPNYAQYESWLGADLMIKGMQLAAPNITQANVIKKLRGITSYNGNGLLPLNVNYSTIFGHDQAKACEWYLVARQSGFVPTSSQPWCGVDLPGTSLANPG